MLLPEYQEYIRVFIKSLHDGMGFRQHKIQMLWVFELVLI